MTNLEKMLAETLKRNDKDEIGAAACGMVRCCMECLVSKECDTKGVSYGRGKLAEWALQEAEEER